MRTLIDTNIAIHLRDGHPGVLARIARLSEAPLLSIVSRIELENGVHRESRNVETRLARLDTLLGALRVLPFDMAAASAYREIVRHVRFSRGLTLDRMIAAHAIAAGATLSTMNGDDFRDLPGLSLDIWSAED